MAEQQHFVDANEFVKAVCKKQSTVMKIANSSIALSLLNWLVSFPKVDVVEVVRCKDCKNYVKMSEQDKEFRCNVFCGCYDRPYPTGPNDFCSYAERRTT